MVDADKPIYPIGVASEILEVHPRTLRIYESHGLVKPARRGRKRYFSENDIKWIRCIRALIHEDGISIEGIRRLLKLQPCWEIRNCPADKRDDCSAYQNNTEPCWKAASRACESWRETCFKCEVFKKKEGGGKGSVRLCAAKDPKKSS